MRAARRRQTTTRRGGARMRKTGPWLAFCLAAWTAPPARGGDIEAKPLRPGEVYRVETEETLEGYLELPEGDKKGAKRQRLPVTGHRKTLYRERILPSSAAASAGVP